MTDQASAYLMTRGTGRQLDYTFLGAPPPDLWWAPLDENDLVILEQPEVIAFGDGTRLSLMISGIPSARQDIIGTPIRFTVVIDGLQDDLDLALGLAAAGLSEDGRADLGRRLDDAFDAATVDGVLSGSRAGSDVTERLATALSAPQWPDDVPVDRTPIEGPWVGPAGSDVARAAFLGRIVELAGGGRGFAFTTRSLTTARTAAQTAVGLPGASAILLADSDLEDVERLGKDEPEPCPRSRRRLLISLGTAAAVAIIALLFALTIFR